MARETSNKRLKRRGGLSIFSINPWWVTNQPFPTLFSGESSGTMENLVPTMKLIHHFHHFHHALGDWWIIPPPRKNPITISYLNDFTPGVWWIQKKVSTRSRSWGGSFDFTIFFSGAKGTFSIYLIYLYLFKQY